MKIVRIIAACGAILCMGMSKSPDDIEKIAAIAVEVDSCLPGNGIDSIRIRFTNLSQKDYWVNTWDVWVALEYEGGNRVEKIKTIEKNTPDRPRFALLKGSGTIEIIEEENFSEVYAIASDKKYQVSASYDNSLEQDNTNFKSLLGYVHTKPVSVRFCR